MATAEAAWADILIQWSKLLDQHSFVWQMVYCRFTTATFQFMPCAWKWAHCHTFLVISCHWMPIDLLPISVSTVGRCWNTWMLPIDWPINYMLAYYMLPIYCTHCLKNAADPRITTTEVNIARTHNFGVKQRQAAKAGWGQMLGRKNGILYNIN